MDRRSVVVLGTFCFGVNVGMKRGVDAGDEPAESDHGEKVVVIMRSFFAFVCGNAA